VLAALDRGILLNQLHVGQGTDDVGVV
jgi:hypothetical protein